MKLFKRKISPKIQAWLWDGEPTSFEDCPPEIEQWYFPDEGGETAHVQTSGNVKAILCPGEPIWLVLEQDGRGAYPMSVDYMKKNFEESPE